MSNLISPMLASYIFCGLIYAFIVYHIMKGPEYGARCVEMYDIKQPGAIKELRTKGFPTGLVLFGAALSAVIWPICLYFHCAEKPEV